jgi:hypothetical protein
MKKILLTSLLAFTMPVMAQHHHGMRHFDHHQHHENYRHHQQQRQSNWGWVAPAVIGGAVVYGLTRPAPVVIQQPPVYFQQPEIVIIDGVSYIKQYQIINGVTTEVLIRQ